MQNALANVFKGYNADNTCLVNICLFDSQTATPDVTESIALHTKESDENSLRNISEEGKRRLYNILKIRSLYLAYLRSLDCEDLTSYAHS